jgi:hypothetical protein
MPSASPSALDLEGLFITAQLASVPMAITAIIPTLAHHTAITALTGSRAAFSSAQVPGLVSGALALAFGTEIVSLVAASTVAVVLIAAFMAASAVETRSAAEVVSAMVVPSTAVAVSVGELVFMEEAGTAKQACSRARIS